MSLWIKIAMMLYFNKGKVLVELKILLKRMSVAKFCEFIYFSEELWLHVMFSKGLGVLFWICVTELQSYCRPCLVQ